MNTDQQPQKHADVTELIIRCFYRVYNELGSGFLESVYEKALLIDLQKNGARVQSQAPVSVFYDGHPVGEFRADLVVNDRVIVELKAVRAIERAFEAQLLNYLKATDIEVGLILNFGETPQIKRMVYDNERKQRQ